MPAIPRRTVALAAALVLITTVPTVTSAQFPGVKETSRSTFTLLPDEGLVRAHAIVDVVNQKKPTKSKGPCRNAPRRTCTTTTRYYLKGWGPIYTPPDAVDVSLGGRKVGTLEVGSSAAGSTWFARFPKLFHKKRQSVEVAFDMPDGGPGAGTETRVTEAYAHFCWYPETVDRGTATAVLPPGWESVSVGSAVKTERTPDATVISTTRSRLPGGTIACTDAWAPTALVRDHVLTPRGQLLTLEGWPADATWNETMTSLIRDGLPVLEHTIGSPMPFSALTIRQVARTNAFGHPTDLDATEGRLLLDEDLGFEGAPLSALARTWFDDGSIAEPWLTEGLVLWSGLSAAGQACPDPGAYPASGAPDLRAWSVSHVPQRVEPMLPVWQAMTACAIVEQVADLVGPARMRSVIASIRDGANRYGDPAGRAVDRAAAGWRDWLDAVDEVGLVPAGVTDLGLAERALIAAGAAEPEDLAGRLSARSLYHDTLAVLDGTTLPDYVEGLMEDWAFDEAVTAIAASRSLFERIAEAPSLSDDQRRALLGVFEDADSAAALLALGQAIDHGF